MKVVGPMKAVAPMKGVAPKKGASAEEGLEPAGGRTLVSADHPAEVGTAAGAASKGQRLAAVGPGHRRWFLVRSDDRPSIDGRSSHLKIAVLLKIEVLRRHQLLPASRALNLELT